MSGEAERELPWSREEVEPALEAVREAERVEEIPLAVLEAAEAEDVPMGAVELIHDLIDEQLREQEREWFGDSQAFGFQQSDMTFEQRAKFLSRRLRLLEAAWARGRDARHSVRDVDVGDVAGNGHGEFRQTGNAVNRLPRDAGEEQ